MKFLISFCLLIVVFSCTFAADNSTTKLTHVIKLKEGKVQGIVEEALNGHKVDTFIGIRYGHAKRFEKATPVDHWEDTYNATQWLHACPQAGVGVAPNKMPFHTETISEDCLFLTVTRPHGSTHTNRSVMFWIHGGGYNSGSIFTTAYDGRYLASQGDVVVVTVQYRLGPFGFLAEESTKETHPGNLGLYDSLLALKWVHENIAHFGGNPHDITIFGESAGSFAVGSLLLSPLAKGLFHRAIMQSGAPNSYFGVQTYKQNGEVSKWLGSRVHCNNDTAAHLVDCLKGKTVQELVDGYQKLTAQDQNFKPVYGEPLLPIKPVAALKSGKFNHDVDLMFGTTSHEGSGFVLWLSPEIHSNQKLTLNSTKEAIKEQMKFFHAGYETEIAQYYTGKLPANATQDQLKLAIADSFGDFHLVCPTILYAEEFAKTVHLTNPKRKFFSYRLMKPTGQMNCTGWQPVCHAEDIFYLFVIPAISSNAELMKLSHDMIHAWTHFAKHGQPGKMGDVHWTEAFERTQTVTTTYMSLDPAAYQMVPKFYQQTCDAFWKPKIFV